ncbi:cuticle protein AMP1A-like [Macrobrachium rosenbergii]|uniref:cuticle protein AMP1A-like n=1 Tax=Macrobrachium rosenbergii TaxID=79674 RepID=UPI0034D49933
MKLVILISAVCVALAAPTTQPEVEETTKAVVPIMKDERVQEVDGRFNVEFEAGNGIVFAQAGSPDAETGAIVQAGQYSYVAPDGTDVVVKFVANENGFQPESDMLPVAPAFPHPIPQFVLDQIAFAAEEDARLANELASGQAEAHQ